MLKLTYGVGDEGVTIGVSKFAPVHGGKVVVEVVSQDNETLYVPEP
jgi:hypothetical protein